jgi:hypothetical protein
MRPNVPLIVPKNKNLNENIILVNKKTTQKNIAICDEELIILFIGQTKPASVHDYRLLKKEDVLSSIPFWITSCLDRGFQGIEEQFPNLQVMLPFKKKLRQELTQYQKNENRIISGLRISSEHAFAGVKRLGSVSQRYRNKGNNLADKFMLLACGIWNLHLMLRSFS